MKQITQLLTLLAMFAAIACNPHKKNGKKDNATIVVEESNKEMTAESAKNLPDPKLNDKKEEDVSGTNSEDENEKDVMPHEGTTSKVAKNDSIYFSMERTACFGRCPIYKLEVYDSGYALYEGIQFTEKEGIFHVKLTKEQMQMIDKEAKKVNYFKLEDKYDSNITDLPSTITSLKRDGERKKVVDRHNAPPQLKNFENSVEEMLMGLDWKSGK